MFIAGLVVFSLASLAGGLARDPVLLIASRVVQGAGAAVVAPAALSLITTSFPEGPRRAKAIGLYGSISAVGFVSGQVLGGVLIEWTSWRSVFLVNVPVGLIAAALAPRIVGPEKKASRGSRRLHRGGVPPPRAADTAAPAAPPWPAQRRPARVPARPVERR
jgi:MFS family permease